MKERCESKAESRESHRGHLPTAVTHLDTNMGSREIKERKDMLKREEKSKPKHKEY